MKELTRMRNENIQQKCRYLFVLLIIPYLFVRAYGHRTIDLNLVSSFFLLQIYRVFIFYYKKNIS